MTSYKWRRRQNILKVLSIASAIFSFTAFIITTLSYLNYRPEYNGLSPFIVLAITGFFALIFWLNKKDLTKIASLSFILFYFFINTYFVWQWSASLPMPIIIYALIIILSGILLGTRVSLFITITIATILIAATSLQSQGIINPNLYWKSNDAKISDKIPEIAILLIISSVIWLYNKEIRKSFSEANRANKELAKEKGLLAFKVSEKEREIQELHLQKMADVYKLAEIGKNSASIFHDLMNPLTAVSLNLQKINDEKSQKYLKEALIATDKMEDFILAIRQHIRQEESWQYFCLNEEIKQVVQITKHRLIKNNIQLKIIAPEIIKTYGSRHKFDQIILNLLNNAIDSYDKIKTNKLIKISVLMDESNQIKLSVRDYGCGINKENLDKVWEMFFSTKNNLHSGSGVGLALIKSIVEKDFAGKITVKSKAGDGTKFICCFPKRNEKY